MDFVVSEQRRGVAIACVCRKSGMPRPDFVSSGARTSVRNSCDTSIGFFTASPIAPWCEKDSALVVDGIRTIIDRDRTWGFRLLEKPGPEAEVAYHAKDGECIFS